MDFTIPLIEEFFFYIRSNISRVFFSLILGVTSLENNRCHNPLEMLP